MESKKIIKIKRKIIQKNLSLIFAVLFLSLGLFTGILAIKVFFQADASKYWPAVEGTIISGDTVGRKDIGDLDFNSFTPEVVFKYHVDGNMFLGTLAPGFIKTSYGFAFQAENITRRYPVGQKVSVYYQPGDPGTSTITPGLATANYIILFASWGGFILGLMGLNSFFYVRKYIKKVLV